MLFDMKPVLFNPDAAGNNEVYYTVFRNLAILEAKIRYDVTVIPQKKIAGETAKTFGHYHKDNYPELYEVLEGHAYFLVQKHSGDPAVITEAYVIEASARDKVVILPDMGHLSINAGETDLVLANWISLVEYDYETIKKYHGGCYYAIEKRGALEFEKNINYKSVPEIKKLRPRDMPELNVNQDKRFPIWDLKSSPQKLEWLINPEKYKEFLTIDKLYNEV